jgi:hypothetical protein
LKAIFEFQLPEDQTDFNSMSKHGDLYGAVWDYLQWMRSELKHKNPESVDLEKCQKKIWECLDAYQVSELFV